ncbi:hypothetical protein DAEQUDRAFT_739662 [Daedalea quercina L-15889]|uniref:Uncharacterized protein n=1 Tax=Daedalea quercina L-15889 TaxID=1314783 RepID=A0A165NEX9_9APHY|nr:hypothetical protein DAEQUDRAFT_739662 [Daedalea quercina L-15889]
MFAFAALPVALAVGAFAMPAALSARQDPCNALGAGASSSLTYNFQLEVVDQSAADSATGAVLALVNSDSNDGLWSLKEIHQNATGDFASWTLNGGALIPTPSSSNSGLVGSDMSVPAGSIVEFAVTNNGSANAAAGQTPYCAVSDADGHATLAVNGDANSFSVCQTPGLAWVLVYNASNDNNGAYTYDSCTKQNVHLVQA